MQYNKGPSIISTYPQNNAIAVPLDVEITVEFDIDISKASIAGSVSVFDRRGDKVDCRLIYENKKIFIKPRKPLNGTTSYRVVVNGDNDPNNPTASKGITNPTGKSLLGDYVFSFSTFANEFAVEDMINGTPNNVVLTEQPTLKATITNNTNNELISVDIEVSDSNLFNDLLWSGNVRLEDMEKGVQPDYQFPDGSYYWRIRGVGKLEGNWSETFQFGIETKGQATVVGDDEIEIDAAFPSSWDMLEPNIIAVFPEDKDSNISVNLQTINIVLDKIVPADILNQSILILTGYSVDDDENKVTHGNVDYVTNVAYDHTLGTTTIVITIPKLGGS